MKANNMTYKNAEIKPGYEHMHPWEVYAFDLMTEYEQCRDEGLDVEPYYDLFAAAMIVAAASSNDIKTVLLGSLGEIPHSSIFGVGTVRISECAAKTLAHVV